MTPIHVLGLLDYIHGEVISRLVTETIIQGGHPGRRERDFAVDGFRRREHRTPEVLCERYARVVESPGRAQRAAACGSGQFIDRLRGDDAVQSRFPKRLGKRGVALIVRLGRQTSRYPLIGFENVRRPALVLTKQGQRHHGYLRQIHQCRGGGPAQIPEEHEVANAREFLGGLLEVVRQLGGILGQVPVFLGNVLGNRGANVTRVQVGSRQSRIGDDEIGQHPLRILAVPRRALALQEVLHRAGLGGGETDVLAHHLRHFGTRLVRGIQLVREQLERVQVDALEQGVRLAVSGANDNLLALGQGVLQRVVSRLLGVQRVVLGKEHHPVLARPGLVVEHRQSEPAVA